MENKKLPQRLVRNAGVFYVCHRLSQRGWNATPTITLKYLRNTLERHVPDPLYSG